MADGMRAPEGPEPDTADWELLRIFESDERAQEVLALLRQTGLPCESLDRRLAGPEVLGDAAAGVWLLVPQDRRGEAETRLAETDDGIGDSSGGEVRCTSCDSREFCAVPPSEAPSGSFWLRCLNCGRRTPVGEAVYMSDAFPALPSACPECGSFRVAEADAPPRSPFDMVPPEDRSWCVCENCEHRWQPPAEVKGPGTARSGGPAEPIRRHELCQAPPEILEAAPDEANETVGEEEEPDGQQCPRCLSRRLTMNDTLVAKGGPLRLLCTKCGEVWDEQLPPGAVLPNLPVVRDGDADAQPGSVCPQCGNGESEPCEPPAYAGESYFARLFKALLGGSAWRRCVRCGFQWQG